MAKAKTTVTLLKSCKEDSELYLPILKASGVNILLFCIVLCCCCCLFICFETKLFKKRKREREKKKEEEKKKECKEDFPLLNVIFTDVTNLVDWVSLQSTSL